MTIKNDFDNKISTIDVKNISEAFLLESSDFLLKKLESHLKINIEVNIKTININENQPYSQISFISENTLLKNIPIRYKGIFFFQFQENNRYIYVLLLMFLLDERIACLKDKDLSLIYLNYLDGNWSEPKWELDVYREWENYKI